MTPDLKEALCEYVDGLRAAGRRYDEITTLLEGQLKNSELEKLERWHRQWSNRQYREKKEHAQDHVPIESVEIPVEDPEVEGWAGNGDRGESMELVRYLSEKLVGPDQRSCRPHWRIERGLTEWSASGAANATRPFFTLYLRYEVAKGRNWKALYTKSLSEGQTCEAFKGPGKAAGIRWMHSAVIFRTGKVIDHVEAEARIRRRIYPGTSRALALRLTREAVQIEKMDLVRDKLDQDEISARLAAVMHTYLGKRSGIKSGAHLARLTNRTRQAVSARKLLIAENYYEKTGGRAGFQGLTSASRHREKVIARSSSADAEPV